MRKIKTGDYVRWEGEIWQVVLQRAIPKGPHRGRIELKIQPTGRHGPGVCVLPFKS